MAQAVDGLFHAAAEIAAAADFALGEIAVGTAVDEDGVELFRIHAFRLVGYRDKRTILMPLITDCDQITDRQLALLQARIAVIAVGDELDQRLFDR